MHFLTASATTHPCPFFLRAHFLEPLPPCLPRSQHCWGQAHLPKPSSHTGWCEGCGPCSHTLMSKVTKAELTRGTGVPLCSASIIVGHGWELREWALGRQSMSVLLTTALSDTQQGSTSAQI